MKVLVVEDDARLASVVRSGLEREGWLVDIAPNGTEGLWKATEGTFDVVILDIMMPGLNGYEVVRQMRSSENWTPVMMLTAKDGEYDQSDAFDLGADDYLTKPFSFVVLSARLRALARRGSPERPVVIDAGGLSIDPGRRSVHRGDVEISLTPKEFAVLEVLARRAGQVVSKAEIISAAWDMNFDGDPSIVEVYVAYLRRKIDVPFELHTLETVRGAGYRLVE